MMKRVWVGLLAGAAVAASVVTVGGGSKAEAVPDREAAALLVTAEHEARIAAFGRYLEERRASRMAQSAPKADPFEQLTRIGLDGQGLRGAVERVGLELGDLSRFDLSRIDLSAIQDEERRCLAQAIYYEARNQSIAGKMAVADVVMNRVASPRYPNSVCGVVYQGSQRVTGCQFSFTCDGSMERRIERAAMIESQTLATAVLGGFRLPLTGGATNYHADYVAPVWAPRLTKTAQVGDHVFYRKGAASVRFAMLD
jgi:hypothetical protein